MRVLQIGPHNFAQVFKSFHNPGLTAKKSFQIIRFFEITNKVIRKMFHNLGLTVFDSIVEILARISIKYSTPAKFWTFYALPGRPFIAHIHEILALKVPTSS